MFLLFVASLPSPQGHRCPPAMRITAKITSAELIVYKYSWFQTILRIKSSVQSVIFGHVYCLRSPHYSFLVRAAMRIISFSHSFIILVFFEIHIELIAPQLFGRFHRQNSLQNKFVLNLGLSFYSFSFWLNWTAAIYFHNLHSITIF